MPSGSQAESSKQHSRWGALPYGYLWWIIDDNEQTYAAMGDDGNVIYVNAKKQVVIVVAALFMPDAKDSMGFIKEYIESMLEDFV